MAFKQWILTRVSPGGLERRIPNVISARVERSMEAEGNILEMTVSNYAGAALSAGQIRYQPKDIIKIYAAEGLIDFNNPEHLFGTFVVKNQEIDASSKQITVTATDKTYQMLARVFIKPVDERRVDEQIENIVQTVNEDGNSQTPVVTHIPSTNSKGEPFPKTTYTQRYDSAYELIARYSQPDITGDDLPYHFYFDENDEFYWQYPTDTIAGLVRYGEEPVRTMQAAQKEAEQISMIIFDAGEDLNGDAIVGFEYNPFAEQIRGGIKFQPMTDIARDNPAKEDELNSEYRDRMSSIAKARADNIMNRIGKGLWEITVNCTGSRFNIAGLYEIEMPGRGFQMRDLRCERIVHTFDKGGWQTRVTFVEDPEKLDI